jgi:hypothetical protein
MGGLAPDLWKTRRAGGAPGTTSGARVIRVREVNDGPDRRGTGKPKRVTGAPRFPQPPGSGNDLRGGGLRAGAGFARQKPAPPYYGYYVFNLKN